MKHNVLKRSFVGALPSGDGSMGWDLPKHPAKIMKVLAGLWHVDAKLIAGIQTNHAS